MPETSVLTVDEGNQLLAEIQALRLRLETIEKNLAERIGATTDPVDDGPG